MPMKSEIESNASPVESKYGQINMITTMSSI